MQSESAIYIDMHPPSPPRHHRGLHAPSWLQEDWVAEPEESAGASLEAVGLAGVFRGAAACTSTGWQGRPGTASAPTCGIPPAGRLQTDRGWCQGNAGMVGPPSHLQEEPL